MKRNILALILITIIICFSYASCSQTSSRDIESKVSITASSSNTEANNDDNSKETNNLTYDGKIIKDIELFSNGYKINVSSNSLALLLSAENEENEIDEMDSHTVFAKIVLIYENNERFDYGEIVVRDSNYILKLYNNKLYKLDNLNIE